MCATLQMDFSLHTHSLIYKIKIPKKEKKQDQNDHCFLIIRNHAKKVYSRL